MTRQPIPSFSEWVSGVHPAITSDPMWSMQAYRLAMYAIVCHNADRAALERMAGAPALDQATRAIGSVAANIAEGYSRTSIKDRSQFYSYALGSAREAIAWYDSLRSEIGELVTERQATLIQIRRLLLTILRRGRAESALRALSDPSRRKPRKDP
jgi:four helix bundle protein